MVIIIIVIINFIHTYINFKCP